MSNESEANLSFEATLNRAKSSIISVPNHVQAAWMSRAKTNLENDRDVPSPPAVPPLGLNQRQQ